MKTPEEWFLELRPDHNMPTGLHEIKQIWKDAFLAGKAERQSEIDQITQRISELESKCQNHVEHLTAKYQQGLVEGREKGLIEASDICSKLADACYVGSNPIREGIKRGLRDGSIAILSAINKKESS